MDVTPCFQRIDYRSQGLAVVRQPVLHLGRNFRVDLSGDDAVTLQFPQLVREHALRDVGQHAAQLVEAQHRFGEQAIEDDAFPLAADQPERSLYRATGVGEGFVGDASHVRAFQYAFRHYVQRMCVLAEDGNINDDPSPCSTLKEVLDMKILVVGANGTVGSAVVAALAERHEVIGAGRTHGKYRVDITRDDSVEEMFEAVGPLDAIVSATGSLFFGPVAAMRPADFNVGLQDKLLGQVRLALLGQHSLRDGGSITLTTGIVAQEPIRQGANASAVNAAVEGFVQAAAIELPRGVRINAVSPTMLTESRAVFGPFFPGFESVSAAHVAMAYVRSVEGPQTGRVYRVWQ